VKTNAPQPRKGQIPSAAVSTPGGLDARLNVVPATVLAPAAATLDGMEAQVTIPFPPDLFEALARRIAELLTERPEAQRYMDADEAAAYLGIPVKTLRTKEWRYREGIPYGQLGGGRLIFDRLALDERFASTGGAAGGRYAVTRIAARPQGARL
jgi:helix-turn-helix protein